MAIATGEADGGIIGMSFATPLSTLCFMSLLATGAGASTGADAAPPVTTGTNGTLTRAARLGGKWGHVAVEGWLVLSVVWCHGALPAASPAADVHLLACRHINR